MARSIKLTITPPAIQTIDGDTGYYVKFTLSEAVEMPNELFVYRLVLPSLENPDAIAFSHLSSPHDIEEYPPSLATVMYSDFFRTAEAEFLFKTIDMVVKYELEIQAKVADVVAKLNLLDTLTVTESINIPV